MYTIKVNDKEPSFVQETGNGKFNVNGKEVDADIVEIRNGTFHIIINNKSYNAEIIDYNKDEKSFVIRVNNNSYTLHVSDRFDVLLKELGLDDMASAKASDLKAPMPGLVVDVSVNPGDQVKKGDKLLVLEAMKMENILKAPADGIVKEVNISKGNKVEKNEILIQFA